MTVAENIFLSGHNVSTFASRNSLAGRAKPLLDEVGLERLNPNTRVERLSVGEQHLVEVARLIGHDPRVLILDEPTAALGERQRTDPRNGSPLGETREVDHLCQPSAR